MKSVFSEISQKSEFLTIFLNYVTETLRLCRMDPSFQPNDKILNEIIINLGFLIQIKLIQNLQNNKGKLNF
ncbi:hypothetical protein BpHYR1_002413 [Brachionus plicatilis]|uniref:Uncharacterized protein n=1 Tax=Brachionus plicatilis TaxID=10195 RepID=A0A3M7PLG6_BRAPC|nr:hypothetical protein BpHYR1_002413 [Brachionus plicatilis]